VLSSDTTPLDLRASVGVYTCVCLCVDVFVYVIVVIVIVFVCVDVCVLFVCGGRVMLCSHYR
jgi:hypothetical protein